jgi:hypothetical protein
MTTEGDDAICMWCDEEILLGEGHERIPAMHHECGVRALLGSVAHLEKRCGCYHPSDPGRRGAIDDPKITKRMSARAVIAWLAVHEHPDAN